MNVITLLAFLIAFSINTDLVSAGSCTPESGLLTANTQNFILIAGAGLSFAGGTNSTILTGDVASYPLATSLIGNSQVILYGINYLNGSTAQTAKSDVLTAYATAASKNPRIAIIADLGGTTVTPGVHEAPSSIMNSGILTLDGQGNPAASFVFIAASTLTTSAGSQMILTNGAQSCHVFWLVGSSATLGVNSQFYGTVIAQISISLLTGANATGRFLCDSAITMDTNRINLPGCTSSQSLLANDCVAVAPLATTPVGGPLATTQPVTATNQPPATVAPGVSAVPVSSKKPSQTPRSAVLSSGLVVSAIILLS